ncbi:uncharacterized protein LOC132047674 [Lycium ferocissimum]|uniref:uncharacterized protein LOC132047674 n=1 Tax=Lycium ferocissimum TaxID=112874 RepID=UPI002815EB65|nr:uncharacterized protein LOC132047674 [Lycium ferocissimum]
MVKVLSSSSSSSWLFSAIYASNALSNRMDLWDNLVNIAKNYNGKWFIGGDFNEVLQARDKSGGNGINNKRVNLFWNCLNQCNLVDLGEVFDNCYMPPEMNSTLLCSIPKCTNGIMMKNFRPIGLCNTACKLVTKIIVNRIKPSLPEIIRPNQSSFLSNRRASDNAIVQEYISHFKKMKGKNPNMILKIDLEKAFDSPSRGIRHGDPMSPYLFILCMERPSRAIDKDVDSKIWYPSK